MPVRDSEKTCFKRRELELSMFQHFIAASCFAMATPTGDSCCCHFEGAYEPRRCPIHSGQPLPSRDFDFLSSESHDWQSLAGNVPTAVGQTAFSPFSHTLVSSMHGGLTQPVDDIFGYVHQSKQWGTHPSSSGRNGMLRFCFM